MSARAVEGEHAQVSHPISIAQKTLRVVPAMLMPTGGIRPIEPAQISVHPEACMVPSVPEKNWTRVVTAAAGANRSKTIVPCSISALAASARRYADTAMSVSMWLLSESQIGTSEPRSWHS